jgi:aliphatic nitrilase
VIDRTPKTHVIERSLRAPGEEPVADLEVLA